MYAWTTQGFVITVEGEDLSDADVHVTFRQFHRNGATIAEVTVSDPTVEVSGGNSTVTCGLSQAQSGQFQRGVAYVQVNAVWSGNVRKASEWMGFEVTENLLDEEVDYA